MKQIKIIAILLFFIGLMVVYNGCKEECPCDDPTNPLCENYDPCYGKKEINTFFKVRPGDRGFKPDGPWCVLMPCDTFNESSVRFDIPDSNPENSIYEWQIGSEAEPRTGIGFEISFYDYLKDKGWERWIPITLTIRTPLNSCLTNPKDTLITVTRELFFTEKQLTTFELGENSVKYRGYFTNKPNEEVILEHIRIRDGVYVHAVVGVPFADTFFIPGICKYEFCRNYRHAIVNYYTTLNHCNEEFDFKVKFRETIFLEGRNRIKQIYVFDDLNGNKRFEFIGTKL